MRLHAKSSCRVCSGKGQIQESHGEIVDCDCVFTNTEHTAEEIESALNAGTVEIVPHFKPCGVVSVDDVCKRCGYPLILRKNDPDGYEEEEYEDNNGGVCGDCLSRH